MRECVIVDKVGKCIIPITITKMSKEEADNFKPQAFIDGKPVTEDEFWEFATEMAFPKNEDVGERFQQKCNENDCSVCDMYQVCSHVIRKRDGI